MKKIFPIFIRHIIFLRIFDAFTFFFLLQKIKRQIQLLSEEQLDEQSTMELETQT